MSNLIFIRFFRKNRTLYYDNLSRVREKNDINQWFKFFLVGVIETAQKGIDTFDKILQLKKEVESKIMSLGGRYISAVKLLDYLYKKPLISAQKVIELTDISAPTAYKLLSELEELGILKETTGRKRKKIYMFKEYIDLF